MQKEPQKSYQKEWLSKQPTSYLLYLRIFIYRTSYFPVYYPIDENSKCYHSDCGVTYELSSELLYAELAKRPHYENNKKLRGYKKKKDKKRLQPNWKIKNTN